MACAEIAAQMVVTNSVKTYDEHEEDHVATNAAVAADSLVTAAAEVWKEFHQEDVFDDGPVRGTVNDN